MNKDNCEDDYDIINLLPSDKRFSKLLKNIVNHLNKQTEKYHIIISREDRRIISKIVLDDIDQCTGHVILKDDHLTKIIIENENQMMRLIMGLQIVHYAA